jgi:hypothetical protein
MSTFRPAVLRVSLAMLLLAAAATGHAEGRFNVSADGQEAIDSTTHLVWRRCAEGMRWDGKACAGKLMKYDYRGAKRAAAAAGNGWRLPTRDELVALVDRSQKKKPRIDGAAFPKTPSTGFWATRPGSDDDLNAWLVNFGSGRVLANLGQAKFPLRLVRAGS